MRIDACTVTFGGVTLTEEPHGIAGFDGQGSGPVHVGTAPLAATVVATPRGNDSQAVSFTVRRRFSTPALAGSFARTHYAALVAATSRTGNLDFVHASGTDRMTGASLQSVRAAVAEVGVCVDVAYSFIGPPITTVA